MTGSVQKSELYSESGPRSEKAWSTQGDSTCVVNQLQPERSGMRLSPARNALDVPILH